MRRMEMRDIPGGMECVNAIILYLGALISYLYLCKSVAEDHQLSEIRKVYFAALHSIYFKPNLINTPK